MNASKNHANSQNWSHLVTPEHNISPHSTVFWHSDYFLPLLNIKTHPITWENILTIGSTRARRHCQNCQNYRNCQNCQKLSEILSFQVQREQGDSLRNLRRQPTDSSLFVSSLSCYSAQFYIIFFNPAHIFKSDFFSFLFEGGGGWPLKKGTFSNKSNQ